MDGERAGKTAEFAGIFIAIAVNYLAKKRGEYVVGSYGLFKLFYCQ